MFDIFHYSLCFVEEGNNHRFKLWHMIEHGVKYEGVKLLGNTHQKVFRAGMLSSALNLLFLPNVMRSWCTTCPLLGRGVCLSSY